MNTTNTLPIKYLKQDAEGNIYAIPEKEEFAFTLSVEAIQDAEVGTMEWLQLTSEFAQNYQQYRRE